eukprot:scaffold25203_cov118-Isochrysis_galbana.AAC.7
MFARDAKCRSETIRHRRHFGSRADLAEGQLEVEPAEARRHGWRVLHDGVIRTVRRGLCHQIHGARDREDQPVEALALDAAAAQVLAEAVGRALRLELVVRL